MNWFMKLSLAKKLLSAFFTLAIIAGAMGLYGLKNIVSVGNSVHYLYQDNLLATAKAQVAFREFLIYSRVSIRMLTSEGTAREDTVKIAIAARERSQAGLDEFRQTANMTPELVAITDKIQKALDEYILIVQRSLGLAREGRLEEAFALANSDQIGLILQIEQNFGLLVADMLKQAELA